ncbi:MAG: amino acid permease, partial [Ilumatobacteraceae bacterium]
LVLTAASRMIFAMSRAGDLPRVGSRLSRDGTPALAVVVSAVIGATFVLWGDLKLIASATDFAIYAIFLSVNVMVVVLRRREPERMRQFRSPWSVRDWPVLPILGFAITVWMIVLLEFEAIVVGVGLFAVGVVVATLRESRSGASVSA